MIYCSVNSNCLDRSSIIELLLFAVNDQIFGAILSPIVYFKKIISTKIKVLNYHCIREKKISVYYR